MNWSSPMLSGNPLMMAFSFQMAAFSLLMDPTSYKFYQE